MNIGVFLQVNIDLDMGDLSCSFTPRVMTLHTAYLGIVQVSPEVCSLLERQVR